jgi:hypothetical protein
MTAYVLLDDIAHNFNGDNHHVCMARYTVKQLPLDNAFSQMYTAFLARLRSEPITSLLYHLTLRLDAAHK